MAWKVKTVRNSCKSVTIEVGGNLGILLAHVRRKNVLLITSSSIFIAGHVGDAVVFPCQAVYERNVPYNSIDPANRWGEQ